MTNTVCNTTGGVCIGYVRVSSVEQNTARQLDGLNLHKVFTDKMTGSVKNRPELEAMLEYVREGDTVVVHSLDRLARNFNDLLDIIETLKAKGVTFKSIKENITIYGNNSSNADEQTAQTMAMNNLILQVFGAIAEFNRSLIREAQREGIAKAKKRGVYTGRKPSLTDEKIVIVEQRLKEKEKDLESYKSITYEEIAKEVGISLTTLNRYLKKRKEQA